MESAMAGWGEITGLVIFALISLYVNNKRKKEEEAAQGKAPIAKPSARTESISRPNQARPAPKPVPDDGEDEEDWTGETWDGEHSERWDDRQTSEQRSPENRTIENRSEQIAAPPKEPARRPEVQRNIPVDRPDQGPAATPNKAKEKASEIGKDLLSQLAKELGLELPQGKPAPSRPQAPRPPTPPSTPAPAPSRTLPTQTAYSGPGSPDEIRNRTLEADRARPGTLYSHRAVQSVLGSAKVPAIIPGLAAGDLTDADSLRRAMILKTILDVPVSKKRRG